VDSKKSQEGLISILMPVKNAAPFLAETLNSIINQSHNRWELISVDDNSTDESYQILDYYAQYHKKIKVFKNRGHGIIDALQTAESEASGEMVSRMDADDLLPADRYENQFRLLMQLGNNHLITGKVNYFSSSKRLEEGFVNYANWLNHLSENNSHYNEIYKECVIASPSWLMYRSDFEEIGGFSGLIYPEDYDFVFRLYSNKIKVAAVPEIVLHWRDHPERASRNLPQYRDVTFFELKWNRFIELDRNSANPLVLYGAGPKGKKLAKIILADTTDFHWVSGNKNKIQHNIYGKTIQNESMMNELESPFQLIVAISSPDQLKEVKKHIPSHAEIFYFC